MRHDFWPRVRRGSFIFLAVGLAITVFACSSPLKFGGSHDPVISVKYANSRLTVNGQDFDGSIITVKMTTSLNGTDGTADITGAVQFSPLGNDSFTYEVTPTEGAIYTFTAVDSQGRSVTSAPVHAPYTAFVGSMIAPPSLPHNTDSLSLATVNVTTSSGGYDYVKWYEQDGANPEVYLGQSNAGQSMQIPVTWDQSGNIRGDFYNYLGVKLSPGAAPVTIVGLNQPPSLTVTYFDGTTWVNAGTGSGSITVTHPNLVTLRIAVSDPNNDTCETIHYNAGVWVDFNPPAAWGATFVPSGGPPLIAGELYLLQDPDATGNQNLYEVEFLATASANPYSFVFSALETSTIEKYPTTYNLNVTVQ